MIQARLVLLRLHNLGQAARHFLVLGAQLVKLAQHLRQLDEQLDQAAVHVGHAGHVPPERTCEIQRMSTCTSP